MNFINSILTPDDIHKKVEKWFLDTGYEFEVYEDYKHLNMKMAATHYAQKVRNVDLIITENILVGVLIGFLVIVMKLKLN